MKVVREEVCVRGGGGRLSAKMFDTTDQLTFLRTCTFGCGKASKSFVSPIHSKILP